MNLTTYGKYAVTAALDLAINEKQAAFLKIADVAERQSIPSSYLEQIFNHFRKANILSASRGPKGGFRLSRPSDEIMIGEIIKSVEKRMDATQCSGDGTCNSGSKCVAHNFWIELNENIDSFLMQKSLKDVLDSRREKPEEKDEFLIATG